MVGVSMSLLYINKRHFRDNVLISGKLQYLERCWSLMYWMLKLLLYTNVEIVINVYTDHKHVTHGFRQHCEYYENGKIHKEVSIIVMVHDSDNTPRCFVCCDTNIYTVNVIKNKYMWLILQTF